MAWKMEILTGYKKEYVPATRQPIYSGGTWEAVCLPQVVPGVEPEPYRYDDKRDAEHALARLCPDLPDECKRVVPDRGRAVEEFMAHG